MKIAIGNDHQGLKTKTKLVKYLTNNGFDMVNYGTDTDQSVDYPDYAKKVATAVVAKEADLGILICKTGIGMSIACNKINGAFCAKPANIKEAKLSREHNNANVIAISGAEPFYKTKKLVAAFLNSSFSNDQRHIKRLDKIGK